MSFSQKHFGKVLVPWFSTGEWNTVYDLIYSKDKEKQFKALHILKIWKMRTSILSAGVEGSLILLDALLTDKDKLTEKQISQIYSLSLMRFLNLCATNSDAQGKFNKTALKNEVPHWLISLRHDIAHNHKLPSESLLKMSLDYCLEWLRTKYWEEQRILISDFLVENRSIEELPECLRVYVHFALNKGLNCENDVSLQQRIYRLVSNKRSSKSDLFTILENKLTKSLMECNKETIVECVTDIIVFEFLLTTTPEKDLRIDPKLRIIWGPILNIFHHHNNFLMDIVTKLFNTSANECFDNSRRKLASIWLYEILLGLLQAQTIQNQFKKVNANSTQKLDPATGKIIFKSILLDKEVMFKDIIDFDPVLPIDAEKIREFQLFVMKHPPEHMPYLKILLKLTDSSLEFCNNTCKILNKLEMNYPGILTQNDIQIYTVDDLLPALDESLRESLKKAIKYNEVVLDKTVPAQHQTKRWNRVADTTIFQSCPLGILLNQTPNVNPFLATL